MRAGAMRAVAVLACLAMLAGCMAPVDRYYSFDADAQYKNPGVFPGNYTFGGTSTVLVGGHLAAGKPVVMRLRSTLNAYAEPVGGTLSDGQVDIVIGLWLPENATQDAHASLPVIVDAGPYFEESQCVARDPVQVGPQVVAQNGYIQGRCRKWVNATIDQPQQTTPFSLKNFLPRGYAVAQVAVRGTGTAGGCMDLMGPAEVHDLDQAITWLATQPWSNGNVAMIGASYDGSTPWEVAGAGNVHLKTIVPVSGLPDIYDLMFHNGSAETRGPVMHDRVYWPFGFDSGFPQQVPEWPTQPPEPLPVPVFLPGKPQIGGAAGRSDYQDTQNLLCPEVVKGAAMAQLSSNAGGRWSEGSDYWSVRDHRDAVVQNYKGSVFLIHGLQDWNVDPHSAIPFNTRLRGAGLDMKEWYGQWDHAFPDSRCRARTPDWVSLPCRLDFADVLGRWFDRYLKDNATVEVGPSVQVQTDVGSWRNADAFPPAAPNWTELHLTGDSRLVPGDAGPEVTVTLDPPRAGPLEIVEMKSEPMAQDLRVSGLPRLQVPFAPKGSGGMLAAWLFDENADGKLRAPYAGQGKSMAWQPTGLPIIGHAQLNLLYYNGGETRQELVPGQRHDARIEFEPLDVLVPKGHRLVLWLFQYEYPDHSAATTQSPVDVYLGGSGAVLRLPTIDVDPTTVFPVPGVPFPQPTLADKMHTGRPVFPDGIGTPVPTPLEGSGSASAEPSDPTAGLQQPLAFLSQPCGACTP